MEICVCYATEVERLCSLHLALPPTTSQEVGDYGNWVCTVNFVSNQASRQKRGCSAQGCPPGLLNPWAIGLWWVRLYVEFYCFFTSLYSYCGRQRSSWRQVLSGYNKFIYCSYEIDSMWRNKVLVWKGVIYHSHVLIVNMKLQPAVK